jgi:hypothetical protein
MRGHSAWEGAESEHTMVRGCSAVKGRGIGRRRTDLGSKSGDHPTPTQLYAPFWKGLMKKREGHLMDPSGF